MRVHIELKVTGTGPEQAGKWLSAADHCGTKELRKYTQRRNLPILTE
jgi:hypothetical protein